MHTLHNVVETQWRERVRKLKKTWETRKEEVIKKKK
jgi:hypothetical protein